MSTYGTVQALQVGRKKCEKFYCKNCLLIMLKNGECGTLVSQSDMLRDNNYGMDETGMPTLQTVRQLLRGDDIRVYTHMLFDGHRHVVLLEGALVFGEGINRGEPIDAQKLLDTKNCSYCQGKLNTDCIDY